MEWKNVHREKYSHLYMVSNTGEVKTIKTGKILKQNIRNGYKAVCLYNGKLKCQNTTSVHTLVGNAFCTSKHDNQVHINHIDGNKCNNHHTNLEWATPKQNTQHAIRTKLAKPHPKKVLQYSVDGEYIATYDSILEASEKTGANDRHISCVCKSKRNTCGGFIWKYYNPDNYAELPEGIVIDNFPNYLITRDGIYSKRAKKYLKPKIMESGYEMVKLCNNGISRDFYIHKLINEAFTPNSTQKCLEGSGENSEEA